MVLPAPVPGVTLGLHHKDHFFFFLLSLKFSFWFNMIKTGVLLKIAVFFFFVNSTNLPTLMLL